MSQQQWSKTSLPPSLSSRVSETSLHINISQRAGSCLLYSWLRGIAGTENLHCSKLPRNVDAASLSTVPWQPLPSLTPIYKPAILDIVKFSKKHSGISLRIKRKSQSLPPSLHPSIHPSLLLCPIHSLGFYYIQITLWLPEIFNLFIVHLIPSSEYLQPISTRNKPTELKSQLLPGEACTGTEKHLNWTSAVRNMAEPSRRACTHACSTLSCSALDTDSSHDWQRRRSQTQYPMPIPSPCFRR